MGRLSIIVPFNCYNFLQNIRRFFQIMENYLDKLFSPFLKCHYVIIGLIMIERSLGYEWTC